MVHLIYCLFRGMHGTRGLSLFARIQRTDLVQDIFMYGLVGWVINRIARISLV